MWIDPARSNPWQRGRVVELQLSFPGAEGETSWPFRARFLDPRRLGGIDPADVSVQVPPATVLPLPLQEEDAARGAGSAELALAVALALLLRGLEPPTPYVATGVVRDGRATDVHHLADKALAVGRWALDAGHAQVLLLAPPGPVSTLSAALFRGLCTELAHHGRDRGTLDLAYDDGALTVVHTARQEGEVARPGLRRRAVVRIVPCETVRDALRHLAVPERRPRWMPALAAAGGLVAGVALGAGLASPDPIVQTVPEPLLALEEWQAPVAPAAAVFPARLWHPEAEDHDPTDLVSPLPSKPAPVAAPVSRRPPPQEAASPPIAVEAVEEAVEPDEPPTLQDQILQLTQQTGGHWVVSGLDPVEVSPDVLAFPDLVLLHDGRDCQRNGVLRRGVPRRIAWQRLREYIETCP